MTTPNPHNQGQGDAAAGEDRTPPNPEATICFNYLFGFSGVAEEMRRENAEYHQGYDAVQRQQGT